ncbi:GNAT family N-acetyltransferase [Leptospira stimsonii]|uniref:GNAT family N-acetyltransferase n=1 Tax=Leptospira stimsonii TaxID=2202203 RepID=A0A4R9L3W3_9LEPT|nr:GNAT family N-acetyltransferase [Leptospira stimsonii]RHX88125.1 GNAT family N-acetyltransferase [Leptospira stimsonii]TGK23834.1 GNAT family N-acetyltransferase [Leptospira stimsonii]TGM10458.1 GNAT family N-acetyltransferase [Leptospira stimsonii]
MSPDVHEITKNYTDLHRVLSDLIGSPILDRKNFIFYSNADSDWFSRIVLKESLSPISLEEEILELRKEGYRSDVLDFLISRTHEKNLKKIGYKGFDEQWGMYLAGDPIPLKKKDFESDFNIRKIETADELKIWLQIVNASFESNDRENLYLKLLNQSAFRIFGGFLGQTMVATGMTFFNGTSFGLYSITTDSRKRGFGYGSVLVESILEELRKEHSNIIILHATKMGKGIYEKFGFKKSMLLRHWS